VEARYDESYSIAHEELVWLGKRVSKLQKISGECLQEKAEKLCTDFYMSEVSQA
jgi:hypothetical protein